MAVAMMRTLFSLSNELQYSQMVVKRESSSAVSFFANPVEDAKVKLLQFLLPAHWFSGSRGHDKDS